MVEEGAFETRPVRGLLDDVGAMYCLAHILRNSAHGDVRNVWVFDDVI